MADDDFLGEWQAWRTSREERLAAPHGFLAITGLHWLTDEPCRVEGVPGAWSAGADGVRVDLADGETLELEGAVVTGTRLLGAVDESGIRAVAGDLVIEVAARGDAVVLRPRDPANRRRTGHQPTPTYPPSPDWVVTGRLIPAPADEELAVTTVVDGLTQVERVAGTVSFEIGGTACELTAFAEDDGSLWILFADATAGATTYGAGRQLSAPPPGADGSVVLDFNRAANLPCAYTTFATCPFPPPGNRLPVAIEAGEQDPALSRDRVTR